jgi:hypothetical protein
MFCSAHAGESKLLDESDRAGHTPDVRLNVNDSMRHSVKRPALLYRLVVDGAGAEVTWFR